MKHYINGVLNYRRYISKSPYPIGTRILVDGRVRVVFGQSQTGEIYTDSGKCVDPLITDLPHPDKNWYLGYVAGGFFDRVDQKFETEDLAIAAGNEYEGGFFTFTFNNLQERFVLHEVMST